MPVNADNSQSHIYDFFRPQQSRHAPMRDVQPRVIGNQFGYGGGYGMGGGYSAGGYGMGGAGYGMGGGGYGAPQETTAQMEARQEA